MRCVQEHSTPRLKRRQTARPSRRVCVQASGLVSADPTIPDAAALILAVTALAELSRWPAALSTSHTAVIADLARNEAMGGLRLAALYDLRVRELSGRSDTERTGPRQSHVDHEWRAGRDHWRVRSAPFAFAQHRPRRCPHVHHEPIATVARQTQPAQSPSPHLAQRRAAQSSSASPARADCATGWAKVQLPSADKVAKWAGWEGLSFQCKSPSKSCITGTWVVVDPHSTSPQG